MKRATKQPANRCDSCDKPLDTKRRFCDERCHQIEECKKSKPKYQAKVAKEMQRMIRAEAAAEPAGYARAVFNGEVIEIRRYVGQCVCVTCGIVRPWTLPKESPVQMQTGHFLAGRLACILFEEDNVAPQCSTCNGHKSGMPQEYRRWMEAVRPDSIERLEWLKRQSISIDRETLVDMRLEFSRRLKAAETKMKG